MWLMFDTTFTMINVTGGKPEYYRHIIESIFNLFATLKLSILNSHQPEHSLRLRSGNHLSRPPLIYWPLFQ